jgi:hypothetical protein
MSTTNDGAYAALPERSRETMHDQSDPVGNAEPAAIWLSAQATQQRRLHAIGVEMEALGLDWITAVRPAEN